MIERGLFRLDLFYRLGIAKRFLVEFSREHGRPFTGFTPETETHLLQRRWRGNIRELRNDARAAALLNMSYYSFRYRKKKVLGPAG